MSEAGKRINQLDINGAPVANDYIVTDREGDSASKKLKLKDLCLSFFTNDANYVTDPNYTHIDLDKALNTESENGVTNKAIAEEFSNRVSTLNGYKGQVNIIGTNRVTIENKRENGQIIVDCINELPEGGTEGQILTKNSDVDYDIKWHTLDLSSIPIDQAIQYEVDDLLSIEYPETGSINDCGFSFLWNSSDTNGFSEVYEISFAQGKYTRNNNIITNFPILNYTFPVEVYVDYVDEGRTGASLVNGTNFDSIILNLEVPNGESTESISVSTEDLIEVAQDMGSTMQSFTNYTKLVSSNSLISGMVNLSGVLTVNFSTAEERDAFHNAITTLIDGNIVNIVPHYTFMPKQIVEGELITNG